MPHMHYPDGQMIMLGDHIRIGAHQPGTVVVLLNDNLYASGYSAQEWQSRGTGLVVNSPSTGDVYYRQAEKDFVLVNRAETMNPD
ncbi:MAG: hypothetical protein AB7H77_02990 [Bdellovibrionales bacterium]